MSFLRRHRVILVLLALVGVVGALVLLRLRDRQARASVRPRSSQVQVGVLRPERRALEVMLAYTGDILPNRQTPIFAKTSGYIRAIHAERGDFVEEGALLVEIDPTELETGLEQARAAVASAEVALEVARSNLESARANLLNQQALLTRGQAVLANDRRQAERLAELFGKGLVSAQERDNARTAHEASQAAVRAQEAQVRVSEVQIATSESQVHLAQTHVDQQRVAMRMAQVRLADTRVLAPFSGFVAERRLEVGAAVSSQAAATSNASIAILTLQAIDPVKVQIEVPEREVARVQPGNVVRLTTDAYPGRQFSGRLARVVHALDPRTRTMGVEVDIPNPGNQLKPGMYARVELVLEVRPNALLVPLEVLIGSEARPAVFVVRDGKVAMVTVELGAADGPRIEVVKGLAPDDEVVLQGKELVRDGLAVTATPAKSY